MLTPRVARLQDPNNLIVPHVLAPLSDVAVVFIASGPAACHCVAIDADGQLWTWGRNEVRHPCLLLLKRHHYPPDTSPPASLRRTGSWATGTGLTAAALLLCPSPPRRCPLPAAGCALGPACALCPSLAG